MTNYRVFENMEEAFAFCRSWKKEIVAKIDGKFYKISPNGLVTEVQP
jgi:hypothetical protein